MNEEKYFLNDEYHSANEHAEFVLDDFDLDNDEDIENLYRYVHGLQQKLNYITTCYNNTKQFAVIEKNQHDEFKSDIERKLLKILQNTDDDYNWFMLGHEFNKFNNIDSATDNKLSFLCYQKAAELSDNDSYSCFRLGDCYENGIGTEKNLEKAFEYYSIAAKAEEPYFILKFSECYKNGIGTPVDEKKALELYEKAKQISAAHLLQSNKKKFESFKNKLTEETEVTTKNANSWIAFGDCYKNGQGTEKNLEKASECYKKVLAFYEKTDTTAKNYRIVFNRLKEIKNNKISKQEQRSLMENELTEITKDNVGKWIELGDLHRKIKPQSYEKAYECYKKVFDFYEQTKEYDENHRRAIKRLFLCFDKGIGSESEEEKSAIREKFCDYETELLKEKGYI